MIQYVIILLSTQFLLDFYNNLNPECQYCTYFEVPPTVGLRNDIELVEPISKIKSSP